MGRPPKDQSGPATETLTLRLTREDRAVLDRLVQLRASELADEGIDVTATSYVRGLIRREGKARGVLETPSIPTAAKPAQAAPAKRKAVPKPRS
jgi:hypothetical protein